jgi:bacterioferritin (cytochrome b1)
MKSNELTKSAEKGLHALLYQLLETELGGVQVYTAALRCVKNSGLKKEFEKYLGETERHVEIARSLVEKAGLDPEAEAPARLPVRVIGEALVGAMITALESGTPAQAELTAAECVVEAETKDHLNWELVGLVAAQTKGEMGRALKEAYEEVEKEEDHHLYHTTGWARELWIQALGMPAVLPPPEEEKKVKTAIGAARAKNARQEMV